MDGPLDTAYSASAKFQERRHAKLHTAKFQNTIMEGTPASIAKVKEVLSGDSLVLQSLTGSAERIFALAFVDAPHFQFKKEDDPYAFQAREFLISTLAEKQVAFKHFYTTEKGREFGIVWTENGRRYPHEIVREGWATVRNNAGGKEGSEEEKIVNELRALEELAKRDRLGIHSGQDGFIERITNMEDPDQFLKEFKGRTIPAMVESVNTGDRLFVKLFVSDKKHYELRALIAGVQAPKTERKATETGEALPKEPFGEEAKAFVERRLLQRRVNFQVVGLSQQKQLIGILKHPQGDIAIVLAKAGLAVPFDVHSTMVGAPYMAQIRKAQAEAKQQRRGMYHNYVAPKQNDAAAIPVTIVRVLSADTVFVRNNNGAEKRISLSSKSLRDVISRLLVTGSRYPRTKKERVV